MITRRTRRSALLLALASISFAVSGCTVGAGDEATPTPTGTASETEPLRLQLDEKEVVETFERLAAEMHVPGAALLLRTPEGEITAVTGVRELGGTDPVTIDDHIRVGSNTKTMTGTVILQLVQEGALALDDPVSKYRPDVPDGDDITIEQLLNMRSGLFNYTETYELNRALDETPDRQWDPEALVAMGLALPPYFEPDTGWHYSNTNTVLLGLIAEQLEGKPLHQILQERLFDRFELDQTVFPAAGGDLPEPYTHGYMYTDNVFTLADSELPADLQAAAAAGTLLPNDQTHANPSWGWAAGAAISTAGDLADWAEILVKGEALDPSMHRQRLESLEATTDAPDGPRYGHALGQLGPFLGHTGELPGYNSFMGHQPDTDVTLIIWTNLAPGAAGQDPAAAIAHEVTDLLYPGS